MPWLIEIVPEFVIVVLHREIVLTPVFESVNPLRLSVVAPQPAVSIAQPPVPPMVASAASLTFAVRHESKLRLVPVLTSTPAPLGPEPAIV